VRFLLDEHLSPAIAARLRGLGHDAVAVAERDDLRGRPDQIVWEAAVAEARVLVTQDLADFVPLARAVVGGSHHPGLLLVPRGRFPLRLDGTGRLAAALAAMAESMGEVGLDDRVAWLEDG
jgi:hypothetical protein